jgi:hypothetical protein
MYMERQVYKVNAKYRRKEEKRKRKERKIGIEGMQGEIAEKKGYRYLKQMKHCPSENGLHLLQPSTACDLCCQCFFHY